MKIELNEEQSKKFIEMVLPELIRIEKEKKKAMEEGGEVKIEGSDR